MARLVLLGETSNFVEKKSISLQKQAGLKETKRGIFPSSFLQSDGLFSLNDLYFLLSDLTFPPTLNHSKFAKVLGKQHLLHLQNLCAQLNTPQGSAIPFHW